MVTCSEFLDRRRFAVGHDHQLDHGHHAVSHGRQLLPKGRGEGGTQMRRGGDPLGGRRWGKGLLASVNGLAGRWVLQVGPLVPRAGLVEDLGSRDGTVGEWRLQEWCGDVANFDGRGGRYGGTCLAPGGRRSRGASFVRRLV